jgi:hypothetical protein
METEPPTTTLLSIYVVALEDNKYIVHSAYTDDLEEKILKKVELIYDFAKIYKPISIEKKIPITNETEMFVDSVVKQYMFKHDNINTVRGGSYIDVDLDQASTVVLHREYQQSKCLFPEFGYAARFLMETYIDREWSAVDACLELIRVEELWKEYQENKKTMEALFPLISKNIYEELNWIQNFCRNTENAKKRFTIHSVLNQQKEGIEDIQKYNDFLSWMYSFVKTYNQEFEDEWMDLRSNAKNIYLFYPRFMFDMYFLHRNFIDNIENIDNVYYFCDQTLYMFEKCKQRYEIILQKNKEINREIPNLEWTFSKIKYLLEKKQRN